MVISHTLTTLFLRSEKGRVNKKKLKEKERKGSEVFSKATLSMRSGDSEVLGPYRSQVRRMDQKSYQQLEDNHLHRYTIYLGWQTSARPCLYLTVRGSWFLAMPGQMTNASRRAILQSMMGGR